MTFLLLLAVVLGGVAQRLTGMGLALVSVPLIVVAVGPGPGSVIGNLFGAAASLLVFLRTRRRVQWRLLAAMLPAGLLGVLGGAAIAGMVTVAWAQIIVGGLVLVSIPLSFLVARLRPVARSAGISAALAAVAGSTSSLAGIGGPAMAVLRNLTSWDPVTFAATLQPFFMLVGSLAVVSRVVADPAVWPDLGGLWLAIGLALLAGLALGDLVSRRLAARTITISITTVAASGAAWTLVRGIAGL